MTTSNQIIFNDFMKILMVENDRGAALTAAAFLEEMLDKILISFLSDTQSTKDLINGFNAPIGTLSAKAKLVHSLGLIDKESFGCIEKIRKIRNMFAHEWKSLSFTSQQIASVIKSLPVPSFYTEIATSNDLASHFRMNVSSLLLELWMLPDLTAKEKRVPRRYVSFSRPYNTLKEAIEEGEKLNKKNVVGLDVSQNIEIK